MISFAVAWQANTIVAYWETSSERPIAGFTLYRSSDNDRTHAVLVTPEMMPSQGILGGIYRFNDPNVVMGITYTYWLEDVSMDGKAIHEATAIARLNQPIFLPLVTYQ